MHFLPHCRGSKVSYETHMLLSSFLCFFLANQEHAVTRHWDRNEHGFYIRGLPSPIPKKEFDFWITYGRDRPLPVDWYNSGARVYDWYFIWVNLSQHRVYIFSVEGWYLWRVIVLLIRKQKTGRQREKRGSSVNSTKGRQLKKMYLKNSSICFLAID